MSKLHKISPNAIILLKDTLSTVFWYKNSLADYLRLSISDGSTIISKINWKDNPKRLTVSQFIDYLVRSNAHDDLLYIMGDLVNKTDFNDLKKSDNYADLIIEAQNNIQNLKKVYESHENIVLKKEKSDIAKKQYQDNLESKQYFENKLNTLKVDFF